MGLEGLEQPPKTPEETLVLDSGGAQSGALFDISGSEPPPEVAPSEPVDPQLAQLINAWPGLPEAIRAGIAAMVASSLSAGQDR